jgi:hypothetical protein
VTLARGSFGLVVGLGRVSSSGKTSVRSQTSNELDASTLAHGTSSFSTFISRSVWSS